MADLKMIIGGESVEAASGARADVIDPATEQVVGSVPKGGLADVDRAIVAARQAYRGWSHLTPGERGALLTRLADRLDEETQRLAEIEVSQTGKPIKLAANSDVPFANDNLRFMGAQARILEGSAAGEYVTGYTSIVRREPLGVVGSIAPWNYPYLMAAWKVGPALAAGNTVILKPASNTPLTAIELARIALEVGFPPGVFNVVTGPGGEVGVALTEDPRVAMVSLTGDSATGLAHHGSGGRKSQAPASRAGRQGSLHRLRRRRPGGGGAGRGRGRLRQLRPGLHRRHPSSTCNAAATRSSSNAWSPKCARYGWATPRRRRPTWVR